jgi:hypothetical protein
MNEIRMMSDVELLAFVLGSKSAAKKLSMVSIAELFGFENGYDADLHSVAEPRAEYNQVAHKKLQAIHEIWVRCMSKNVTKYSLCNDAKKIGPFLCTKFAGKKHEVMACLFLDNSHKIMRFEEMFS